MAHAASFLIEIKIIRGDPVVFTEGRSSFNDVFQFAYVSRPSMSEKSLAGFISKSDVFDSAASCDPLQDGLSQSRDVSLPLAQGVNMKLQNIEAVIKIRAETPLFT